jgi:predicted nucleic acid-binding protein
LSFLLDTNVLSELRRREPDPGFLRWWDGVEDSDLYTSALVVGEIRLEVRKLHHRGDRSQAERLSDWLDRLVRAYGDRVVPVDVGVVLEWAPMNVPDRIPVVDGLMAATAKHHGWTFVTRNTKDVANRGVRLLNPFTG